MSGRFTTAEDLHNYLESIPMFGRVGASATRFVLDYMEEFSRRMGNPQNGFRSIHVAGTNGKGTTCQMLASVYMEAGYRVGLYTSPHLTRIHERFRVNDETITDEELLEFFRRYERDLEEVPLTYFELSTAIAFWYLNRQNVDLAIIETGLGGRLDATNVITPEVSVITSISLDHTDFLGNTIGEIAREKAGIIKSGRPVVTGSLPEEALVVIRETAAANGSQVFETDIS
ncbi:MAG: Mur ligase family protein, partial [Balneolaceae bacterium]